MNESRYSRTDEAALPWQPGMPSRRAKERGESEPITRGEFCAFRKDSFDFRSSVTEWMTKIDKRMDTQDEQLSGINEIRQHVATTCRLVQWLYKAILAVVVVGAPGITIAKALGWL